MGEVKELLNRLDILHNTLMKMKDDSKNIKDTQKEYLEVVKELDRKRLEEYYKKQNNE